MIYRASLTKNILLNPSYYSGLERQDDQFQSLLLVLARNNPGPGITSWGSEYRGVFHRRTKAIVGQLGNSGQ
jgi:hypothetical protein